MPLVLATATRSVRRHTLVCTGVKPVQFSTLAIKTGLGVPLVSRRYEPEEERFEKYLSYTILADDPND